MDHDSRNRDLRDQDQIIRELSGTKPPPADHPRSITVTGPLVVRDPDGGFGPDVFAVGALGLGEIVARLFGIKPDGLGSLGNRRLGRVRITIDVIEEATP